jgi:ribA/ribD-fused uncharacterized protein
MRQALVEGRVQGFYGGKLSNFAHTPFYLDGVRWANEETHYAHCKAVFFGDDDSSRKIRFSTSPREAKMLGRRVKGFNGPTWDSVCRAEMRRGLEAKFRQDVSARMELLGSRGVLAECSPVDLRWGIGLTTKDLAHRDYRAWRGTNWLGTELTLLRQSMLEELTKESK